MALVAHQAPVDDVLVAPDAKAAAMRHRAFVGELPPEKVRDAHHPPPQIAGKTPDEPIVEFRRRDARLVQTRAGLTILSAREA